MFIGNILLGRLKPAKEIKLIKERKLEKLLIYVDSYRLSPEAETELIADPQGLEQVVEKYLYRYGMFQTENNIRFVQSLHRFKNLFMVLLLYLM